jgi:hypothetical protein
VDQMKDDLELRQSVKIEIPAFGGRRSGRPGRHVRAIGLR